MQSRYKLISVSCFAPCCRPAEYDTMANDSINLWYTNTQLNKLAVRRIDCSSALFTI